MAYIPPHKRLTALALDTDTPIASSTSSASPASPSLHGLKLDYSPFSVRRFLVVSESSTRLLEFIPFEGERVFSHLDGVSLHAIKRDQISSTVHEDQEICVNSDFVIDEEDKESAICLSIVKALRDDLASVIQELRKRMDLEDGMHLKYPKILLSVGRLLFSSIEGRSFDWKEGCTPEFLEQQFRTSSGRSSRYIRKTFFDPQPSNLFTFFRETAEKDNLQMRTKERYFIVVEDKASPGTSLLCVCYLAAAASTATCQENAITLQRLQIRKVKRPTRLRHMIADVACIDKSHDLRIQLYTDEKCLSAEERADMESLLCHVLFVDGQPFLRYDDTRSSSGRFEFDHMFLSKTYSFKGDTFKWRLESVTGMHYVRIKPILVTGMHYVRIKPILVQDYLQGRVECTMDELMRSIEETLVRLWKCLS